MSTEKRTIGGITVTTYSGNALQELKDDLSTSLYGITAEDAIAQGICISCREPAIDKCYSEAGRKKYPISALCEPCWDQIVGPEE